MEMGKCYKSGHFSWQSSCQTFASSQPEMLNNLRMRNFGYNLKNGYFCLSYFCTIRMVVYMCYFCKNFYDVFFSESMGNKTYKVNDTLRKQG